MIDEPANAEPGAVDPLAARLDRPLTELTVDELMALKDEFEKHGVRVYNSLSPELLALLSAAAGAAAIYTKALMETLGRRSGEAFADLIHIRRNGVTTEAHIGLPGDAWPRWSLLRACPTRHGSPCSTSPTRLRSYAARLCGGTAARQRGGPLTTSRPGQPGRQSSRTLVATDTQALDAME